RLSNLDFTRSLLDGDVVMHKSVLGELALGSLRNRKSTVADLEALTSLDTAPHDEVMRLIEARELYSRGIGYVDLHLLAAALAHGGVKLLTRDKRLGETAALLGIAA
ncbi:MAG TPA: PIN domain-containing protein, partial [Devosia sp.]